MKATVYDLDELDDDGYPVEFMLMLGDESEYWLSPM